MCERKATRAIPCKEILPGPLSCHPVDNFAIIIFLPPSLPRFSFFRQVRVRDEPRRRIFSLEYIQITGGAESHRRFVGVPAIISQVALSQATSSIPPFCWINLLVVYIPSTLSLPPPYIAPPSPFFTSLLTPGPVLLYFFPFRVASLFHFLDFPSSPSFLPFFLPSSPSRFSATPFDYSVIAT